MKNKSLMNLLKKVNTEHLGKELSSTSGDEIVFLTDEFSKAVKGGDCGVNCGTNCGTNRPPVRVIEV